MADTTVDTTLICHARTPLVFDPVEERVERAQQLEGGDLVDEAVLRSWPETVRLEDGQHHEVVETFDRYEAWAERRGVSVTPPFEVRTRRSIVADDGVDVLVTPVVCLAVSHDDGLAAVYPHTDGEATRTVDDALAWLEAGHLPRPLRPARDVPDVEDCPECHAELVNGQGLFGCPECDWRGTLSRDGWTGVPAADEGAKRAPSAGD